MIHNIYSVYDSKSEAYSLPFYYQHDGQALRTFRDWVNDITTPYGKHPEDYCLFKIGMYDEVNGTITQDKIESMAHGHTLLQEQT